MGNQLSFAGSGKIVYWDGSVQEIEEPITVAELMLEHPQHVVVEFHSAMNYKRPNPLPADKNLEMNKTYLMLPVKRGKPVVLSSEDIRRILFLVNSTLHSNYLMCSSGILPWFARFFHAKNAAIGEAETLQRTEQVEETYGFCEFLPEMIEGRPEYMSRQLSGKGWKPSLDTIEEIKVKRKLHHWLFLKTFI